MDCIFKTQIRGEWRDRLEGRTRIGIGIGIGSAFLLKQSATENSRKKCCLCGNLGEYAIEEADATDGADNKEGEIMVMT
jgi:hypothetical protein